MSGNQRIWEVPIINCLCDFFVSWVTLKADRKHDVTVPEKF